MPATATELVESRSTGKEPGRNTTTRIYIVTESTPDIALDVVDVPILGDKLPWDSEQEVVALVADYWPNSYKVSRVVVQYSSDGGTTWGGNNPSDPDFKSWTLSYSRVSQAIPYAIRDARTFRYSDAGGVTRFITSYPVHEMSFYEPRKKYIRRLRIRSFNADTMDQIISRQANNLHKIYGRWYLFMTGDVVEVAKNTWDVSYTWEYDPGTRDIVSASPDIAVCTVLNPSWIQHIIYYPDATMARPPFHQVGTIPVYDTVNNVPFWPEFVSHCPFNRFDPSGYTTLPGFSL